MSSTGRDSTDLDDLPTPSGLGPGPGPQQFNAQQHRIAAVDGNKRNELLFLLTDASAQNTSEHKGVHQYAPDRTQQQQQQPLDQFFQNMLRLNAQGSSHTGDDHDTFSRASTQPAADYATQNMRLLLNRVTNDDVHPHAVVNHQRVGVDASMISFDSSMDASHMHEGMGEHNAEYGKVDVLQSLLSMLSSQDRLDSSHTLMLLSGDRDTCVLMLECVPVIVQLLHPGDVWLHAPVMPDDMEVLQHCKQALHSLVNAQPDDARRRRELRVLKALDRIREYTLHLRMVHAGMEKNVSSTMAQELYSVVSVLMKLSFDEQHRHATTYLGGLQAIAELLVSDQLVFGAIACPESSLAIRRSIGMALTNLTYNQPASKKTLCAFPRFLDAVCAQIQAPNEMLKQAFAGVLRNLSWKAEHDSKQALRECGAVSCLMRAAIDAEHESTLKALLSALWNLSSHCKENKIEICETEGALAFLVSSVLTYQSASGSLAVIENGGGILRNISSQVAVTPEYRLTVRQHKCCKILLEHLSSSSLTIVSNACGTLWNLSARSSTDQHLLWRLGAVPKLRSLIHSRHSIISRGSAQTLKHLLQNRPPDVPDPDGDGPMAQRRAKALEMDLDAHLLADARPVSPPASARYAIATANQQSRSSASAPISARVWSSEGHVATSASYRYDGPDSDSALGMTESAVVGGTYARNRAQQVYQLMSDADLVRPSGYYNTSTTSGGYRGASMNANGNVISTSLRSSSDSLSKQEQMHQDRSATQRFQEIYVYAINYQAKRLQSGYRRYARRQQQSSHSVDTKVRASTLPLPLPASHRRLDAGGFAVPFTPPSTNQQRVPTNQLHQSDESDDNEEEQTRSYAVERTPHMSQRGSVDDLSKMPKSTTSTTDGMRKPQLHHNANNHNVKFSPETLGDRVSSNEHNNDNTSLQQQQQQQPPPTSAMFSMNVSRHSSVESLDSADGRSLHSTHTSAPSTRIHTECVSPSELPESPGRCESPPMATVVHQEPRPILPVCTTTTNQPTLLKPMSTATTTSCDSERVYKEDSSSMDDARSNLSALTIDSDTKVRPTRKLLQLSGAPANDMTPRAAKQPQTLAHDWTAQVSPPTDPDYSTFDETCESMVLKQSIEAAMPTPKTNKMFSTGIKPPTTTTTAALHNVSLASQFNTSTQTNNNVVHSPPTHSSPYAYGVHPPDFDLSATQTGSQEELDSTKTFRYEGNGGSIRGGSTSDSVKHQPTQGSAPGSRQEPSSDISHFIQSAMPKPKQLAASKLPTCTAVTGRKSGPKNVGLAKPMLRGGPPTTMVDGEEEETMKNFASEHTPHTRSRSPSPTELHGILDEHVHLSMPSTIENTATATTAATNATGGDPLAISSTTVLLDDIQPPQGLMQMSGAVACSSTTGSEPDGCPAETRTSICDEQKICDATEFLRRESDTSVTEPTTEQHLSAAPQTVGVRASSEGSSDLSEDNFDLVDMVEDLECSGHHQIDEQQSTSVIDQDLMTRCTAVPNNTLVADQTTTAPSDMSELMTEEDIHDDDTDVLIECDKLKQPNTVPTAPTSIPNRPSPRITKPDHNPLGAYKPSPIVDSSVGKSVRGGGGVRSRGATPPSAGHTSSPQHTTTTQPVRTTKTAQLRAAKRASESNSPSASSVPTTTAAPNKLGSDTFRLGSSAPGSRKNSATNVRQTPTSSDSGFGSSNTAAATRSPHRNLLTGAANRGGKQTTTTGKGKGGKVPPTPPPKPNRVVATGPPIQVDGPPMSELKSPQARISPFNYKSPASKKVTTPPKTSTASSTKKTQSTGSKTTPSKSETTDNQAQSGDKKVVGSSRRMLVTTV